MHPNAALIQTLYEAFQRGDGEAMAACYHPQARFSDPVFRDLRGPRAGHMWRMLTGAAKDLQVRFSDVQADDVEGSARWEADYTFSSTGRFVKNRIQAHFTFRDGLILEHTDRFDLWAWTRMALGPTGLLLGWSPIVQGKVRAQAAKGLERWEASHIGG